MLHGNPLKTHTSLVTSVVTVAHELTGAHAVTFAGLGSGGVAAASILLCNHSSRGKVCCTQHLIGGPVVSTAAVRAKHGDHENSPSPVAVSIHVHVQHPAQQLSVVEGRCRLCHAAVALVQQLKQITT